MPQPIEELKKARLATLAKLKKLGISPFPSQSQRQQTCLQALKMLGEKATIAGRIMAIRGHGGIAFFDLVDESGKIQLVFKKENFSADQKELLALLDAGDFIDAQGQVFKTRAGEISVQVDNFHLLAKSLRPLPDSWHGLKDVEERYRQRYVDLIVNPEIKQVFYTRTKILTAVRQFLDDHGFLEVETPILQPLYGGASAKPFITHHQALDCDLYLRISDELYLKRLIVGGFEKVYEVCKDFRNEGIDRQHNPEFTQVEFYYAYADYEKLMELTEEMVAKILQTLFGKTIINHEGQDLDFTPPLPRLKFRDLVFEKTKVDVDKINSEKDFHAALKTADVKLDIKDLVGLGALFDKLYKDKVRPHLEGPAFVIDYPSEMIALAKRKDDDPKKIATFQLVVKGFELCKAYNELNDPLDQRARWEESEALAAKGDSEAERLDEDYLRALEYGMPPTAGWGMGIDRLVSFLTNAHSLKEVILFPTLRPEESNEKK